MKPDAQILLFLLRIEAGLLACVLVLASVVLLSRDLADALAFASIVFLVPQPFLLFSVWRYLNRKGRDPSEDGGA